MMENNELGEWKLCPKCAGHGNVSSHGTSTVSTVLCDVCNGAKVLARPIMKTEAYVFDEEGIIERLKELNKQPMHFVNHPDETEIVEKWSDKILKAMLEKMHKESDYYFGLTHYDWMYHVTQDAKYLHEKEDYKRKHGR